jgi:hypothetical protein
MATEQDAVITTLDAKIEELHATLDALRRTRAFFAAERERGGVSVTQALVNTERESSSQAQMQRPLQMASIGTMILDILHETGRPMHVDDLIPKLRGKGSQASRATVIGTLSRYRAEGKLRRVAPNTYGLKKVPLQQQNATHLPQVPQEPKSVKPAEQFIQTGTREYTCYTILKAQGAFMTLREMLDALTQSGGVLNTPRPLDLLGGVMRQSIRRGKRIFVRDAQGRFGLQEWQNSQIPLNAETNSRAIQNNGSNNVIIDSLREV